MKNEPTTLEIGPESYQFLNTKGRNPTPPWKNWKRKSVYIDPVKRTIEARQSSGSESRDGNNDEPKRGPADRKSAAYTRLSSGNGAQKVTVFVDSTTRTPTTKLSSKDKYENDMVATYNLGKLPFPIWETIYRKLGGRSHFYVRNFNPEDDLSETDTADASI